MSDQPVVHLRVFSKAGDHEETHSWQDWRVRVILRESVVTSLFAFGSFETLYVRASPYVSGAMLVVFAVIGM